MSDLNDFLDKGNKGLNRRKMFDAEEYGTQSTQVNQKVNNYFGSQSSTVSIHNQNLA